MKKSYIKPCATSVRFFAEANLMLATSGTRVNGNSALSNEKEEWSQEHPIWGKIDTED